MLIEVFDYLRARLNAERGATMVEYGLMVAGVAIVVAAAAFILGGGISDLFNSTTDCVNGAATGSAASCP